MEAEMTVATSSPTLYVRTAAAVDPGTKADAAAPTNGCFDCTICLGSAVEPVVTLCGHLFCWPCIFRWFQSDSAGPHRCPVCKSLLSESSIVPLYGCGPESHPRHHTDGIPERPRDHLNFDSPACASDHRPPPPSRQEVEIQRNYQNDGRSDVAGILALALLPWGFRKRRSLNQLSAMRAVAAGGRARRREELIESWMNQLWVFLFCCAVLCFLIF